MKIPKTETGVAYSWLYLNDMREHLGMLFEYGDVSRLNVQDVFDKFVKSEYIEHVKMCHPHYVGGCSTLEFASYVVEDELGLHLRNIRDAAPITSWHWSGSYMALVQWLFDIDWEDLAKYLRLREVIEKIYPRGHELPDNNIIYIFYERLKRNGYTFKEDCYGIVSWLPENYIKS